MTAMTNPQHEALVEAVARALYEVSSEPEHGDNWETMSTSQWGENFRLHARAALSATAATQETAVCAGCEGRPAPENNPCAVCGATADTPSDEEVRLRAENAGLRSDANAVIAYFDRKGVLRDAPGHSHSIAGVWDADNEPGKAGMSCEWCAVWSAFRARAALEPQAKDL